MPALITLLIALAAGGGIGAAAEGSLPGDTLYPVKVNVNEELRSAFAVSTEAQIAWDLRRLERRLEEAEALAVEGSFNAEARQELLGNLEAHQSDVQERLNSLREEGKIDAALNAAVGLEAVYNAHTAIIASLEQNMKLSEDVRTNLGGVLARLRSVHGVSMELRSALEAEFVGSGGLTEEAAQGKLGAVEQVLASIESRRARLEGGLDSQAEAEFDLSIKTANQLVAGGKVKLDNGHYADAFTDFQEALRLASEARVFLSAGVSAQASASATTTGSGSAATTGNATSSSRSSGQSTTTGGANIKVEGEVQGGANTNTDDDGALRIDGGGEIKIELR